MHNFKMRRFSEIALKLKMVICIMVGLLDNYSLCLLNQNLMQNDLEVNKKCFLNDCLLFSTIYVSIRGHTLP